MKTTNWAENEIRLAKEQEEAYGSLCLDSAYKAYQSICEDGHSGLSVHFTRDILNRLICMKPLTPIKDEDDIWNFCHDDASYMMYQCKRMSSLFKYVYKDGSVRYSDVDRTSMIDVNTGHSWHNGLISKVINEMWPIEMPYYPSVEPIKVYVEEFLYDKKNGDFDTIGILHCIKDGERIPIEKYFTAKCNVEDTGSELWFEISKEKYIELKSNAEE